MTDAREDGRLDGNVIAIIAVLVLTAFVTMLNETALSVALPAIMEEFSVPAATAQWLLTGVMLTIAIVMPTTGWVLDRFSTRTVYFTALILFIVGSVFAAISPFFLVLLIGRVLQAIGTALLLPLQMTVVMTMVPAHRRGTIMGIVGIVMAVGPAIGPTFGGAIMAVSTWHMTFWIMVVLLTIVGIIAYFKLQNIGENKMSPLDVLSVILSVFAFGGLVYGLSSIGTLIQNTEDAPVGWAMLAIGSIGLVLFVWRQLSLAKHDRALLNLSPFKERNFVAAVIGMSLFMLGTIGMTNTLPLYMQGALLTTALVAGLVSLPGGIVETILSPIAGALFDRIGPRPIVIPASIVATGSMFWLASVDHNSPVWLIAVIYAVFGVAMSMMFTPMMTTALGSLPRDVYSHGSAIYNTVTQLAAAAGTALIIAIYDIVSTAGGATPQAQGEAAGAAFFAVGVIMVGVIICTLFIQNPRPHKDFTKVEVEEPR